MFKRAGVVSSLLLLALSLAACSHTRTVRLPEPTVIDRSEPRQANQGSAPTSRSVSRVQMLLSLLAKADQALAEQRLTTPEYHNAWHYYRRVLALQPSNEEARRGLVTIIERYVRWSERARLEGRRQQAEVYLQRAARIDADSPLLAKAREKLQNTRSEQPQREVVNLDAAAVRQRSAEAKARLAALADRIKADNARVLIGAPSDASGRWIYQQLNARHEEYRIRANMKIDSTVALELIY